MKNTRRGLGKGLGTGYKNLAPMDSHIHSLSAKGVRTCPAHGREVRYGKNWEYDEYDKRLGKHKPSTCSVEKGDYLNAKGNIKYTPTEKAIAEMLKENTGINMLDSGMESGRHWQKNQKVDFKKQKEVEWDEYGYTRNVFSFLSNHLTITEKSQKFQKLYNKMYKNSDNSDLRDMEDFVEELSEKEMIQDDNYLISGTPKVVNTYNGENALSQVLQYIPFYDGEDYFIILQIHNGADVRGGYTSPKIFKLDEFDDFLMEQTDASATTKDGKQWRTDDTYNWYEDGELSSDKEQLEWDELYKRGIKEIY